jgi:hypothetical protein
MSQSLNPLAPDYRGYKDHMSPDDYKRWCKKMGEVERCKERAACCNEPVVEVVKCEDPCNKSYFDFGWLGMLLLWFIIFTVLFWLIYYSLNPSFVQEESGNVNPSKVLISALISSIVLCLIIWIIKACIEYSC